MAVGNVWRSCRFARGPERQPGRGYAPEAGGLRAAQKRMTRELLLAQALELFESKGYAATTVDDIAAAAGTTRQTFYLHSPRSRRSCSR
jgi:hypothetical protein